MLHPCFVCSPRVAPRYPAIASILRSATIAPIVRIVVTSILGWRISDFITNTRPNTKKSSAGNTLLLSFMALNSLIETDIVEGGSPSATQMLQHKILFLPLISASIAIMMLCFRNKHDGSTSLEILGVGNKTHTVRTLMGAVGSFLVLLLGGKRLQSGSSSRALRTSCSPRYSPLSLPTLFTGRRRHTTVRRLPRKLVVGRTSTRNHKVTDLKRR